MSSCQDTFQFGANTGHFPPQPKEEMDGTPDNRLVWCCSNIAWAISSTKAPAKTLRFFINKTPPCALCSPLHLIRIQLFIGLSETTFMTPNGQRGEMSWLWCPGLKQSWQHDVGSSWQYGSSGLDQVRVSQKHYKRIIWVVFMKIVIFSGHFHYFGSFP